MVSIFMIWLSLSSAVTVSETLEWTALERARSIAAFLCEMR